MKRLPSFNDFSPTLIPDIRDALHAVEKNAGNKTAIAASLAKDFFKSADNKRAQNVLITLGYIGAYDKETADLTTLGKDFLKTPSPQECAKQYCKHILLNFHGLTLVEAVRNLRSRGEKVGKENLKEELKSLGIEKLSTATTDHLTLANWMDAAGILDKKDNFKPNEAALKALIGATSSELDEIQALEIQQQIFLHRIRVEQEVKGHSAELSAHELISACLRQYPRLFDEDQFRKKVIAPLESAGWITTSGATPKGAKSGRLRSTAKLMGIPVDFFVPDFTSRIPGDLRKKINTPLSDIYKKLAPNKKLALTSNKHERGLGLELLALRLTIDLGLHPKGFRTRSKETAFAEADVVAEGKHLMFSRWLVQCKCVSEKVNISDVAREVGLAIYYRAHVIFIVTTSEFTAPAMQYAQKITETTHLQFLFMNGQVLQSYAKEGPKKLIEFVLGNAGKVLEMKKGQLNNPSKDDVIPV